MPYNKTISDDELRDLMDPKKTIDPKMGIGMVVPPDPEQPPWLDEYEAARLAFAHGITGQREEPASTPDHHP